MAAEKPQMPPLTETVAVCTACNHWQVDFHPRSRQLGRPADVLRAAAELHAEHLPDCPGGTEGRIKVSGRWVERPKMQSGRAAHGVLAGQALPKWWVWR